MGCGVSCRQLPVDPANQIAIGDVADEQEQAVGHLAEAAVAQPVGWQRAMINMLGFSAGASRLLIAAVMKLPVAVQLRTRGWRSQAPLNIAPAGTAMALQIVGRNLIGDSLMTENGHQCIVERSE